MSRLPVLLLLCPWLLACSHSLERPAARPEAASALPNLVQHDRVAVAPQPTEDDLRLLAGRGYTHIVNLRTQAEMDDRESVPSDEAALAAELGMQYRWLPVGGADPYRSEVTEGMRQALTDPLARVLLHCASGGRASQAYAAYAVQYLGMDVDAAVRETAAFGGWPLPLERMTGIRLKLVREDE